MVKTLNTVHAVCWRAGQSHRKRGQRSSPLGFQQSCDKDQLLLLTQSNTGRVSSAPSTVSLHAVSLLRFIRGCNVSHLPTKHQGLGAAADLIFLFLYFLPQRALPIGFGQRKIRHDDIQTSFPLLGWSHLSHRCETLARGPSLARSVTTFGLRGKTKSRLELVPLVLYSTFTASTTNPRMLCCYFGASIRTRRID